MGADNENDQSSGRGGGSRGGGGTRYFIMKSFNHENVVQSVGSGIWATQKHNEQRLNDAFYGADRVVLIFSVNMSGHFQGYAYMRSKVSTGNSRGMWEGNAQVGGSFKVGWKVLCDLPFSQADHLRNPLNDDKPVRISRDGQELPPDVGQQLTGLMDDLARQDGNRLDAFVPTGGPSGGMRPRPPPGAPPHRPPGMGGMMMMMRPPGMLMGGGDGMVGIDPAMMAMMGGGGVEMMDPSMMEEAMAMAAMGGEGMGLHPMAMMGGLPGGGMGGPMGGQMGPMGPIGMDDGDDLMMAGGGGGRHMGGGPLPPFGMGPMGPMDGGGGGGGMLMGQPPPPERLIGGMGGGGAMSPAPPRGPATGYGDDMDGRGRRERSRSRSPERGSRLGDRRPAHSRSRSPERRSGGRANILEMSYDEYLEYFDKVKSEMRALRDRPAPPPSRSSRGGYDEGGPGPAGGPLGGPGMMGGSGMMGGPGLMGRGGMGPGMGPMGPPGMMSGMMGGGGPGMGGPGMMGGGGGGRMRGGMGPGGPGGGGGGFPGMGGGGGGGLATMTAEDYVRYCRQYARNMGVPFNEGAVRRYYIQMKGFMGNGGGMRM